MRLRLGLLAPVRKTVIWAKRTILRSVFGMDLHPTCQFSLSTKFDLTNPRGVHVGEASYIAFDVAILTHDFVRGVRRHTTVGRHCFIGCRSIILPGVSIGDGSIVAAGSVVTKDVPPGCIAGGNPAKVLREGVVVGPYGRLPEADAVQAKEAQAHGLD